MTPIVVKYCPPFGPVCSCGHLAFVHRDGEGACESRRCTCKCSSEQDARGKKYGSDMGRDVPGVRGPNRKPRR